MWVYVTLIYGDKSTWPLAAKALTAPEMKLKAGADI